MFKFLASVDSTKKKTAPPRRFQRRLRSMDRNTELRLAAVIVLVIGMVIGVRLFYNPSSQGNQGVIPTTESPTTSGTTTGQGTQTQTGTSTTTTTTTSTGTSTDTTTSPSQPGVKYVVLAWNDLGMHCYNPDFSNIGILPPYNTLWAQVIQVGDPPKIVTQGITVEYSFPDNTYSAGNPTYPDKTNFWDYAQALFGVTLAKNVGLTGRGLSGLMTAASDHFIADGIPLTEFTDKAAQSMDPSKWVAYPFERPHRR